VLHKLLTIYLN